MSTLLTKLWGLLRSKQIVGHDNLGNLYYRQSQKLDGALIEKRWVEFKGEPDPTTVPVEWTSWLSGRRKQAPTPQEVMELEAQRKLVKMKAAMLEKEEEKRRFRAKTLQQGMHAEDLKPSNMNRFVQQVAAMETPKYKGGETTFVDAASNKSQENRSKSSQDMTLDDTLENGSSDYQERITEPKGRGDSFRPGTWRPN